MKRNAAIATLVVSLGLLSACTPDAEETPSPTPSVTTTEPTSSTTPPSDPPSTTSPTPSPSPSPSETLDADQQAAQQVVLDFFRIADDLVSNPTAPVQPLADISIGQTRDQYLQSINRYREMNAIGHGETKVTVLSVESVMKEGDELETVVKACTDGSETDVVDAATGDSILPANRSFYLTWRITTVTTNGLWKFSDFTNEPTESCEP